MAEVVKSIYSASFYIWNTLIEVAMTLFQTSPKAAGGGGAYSVIYTLYNALSSATIPIATVFFIIALYKTVITSPPEQQAQRFLMDAIRYCIILFIAANLWSILGTVIDIADGMTSAIGGAGSYTLSVNSTLNKTIDETLVFPDFELTGECVKKYLETIGCYMLFMISGMVMVFVMVASCVSILSSGFQRILKPLIILPFSGRAVAMGAGGHDISRSLLQYVKTFFGFCISGALMIICIKVGASICTTLVNFDLAGQSNIVQCILITVQSLITPIVISGLVKGCDSIVQRMI